MDAPARQGKSAAPSSGFRHWHTLLVCVPAILAWDETQGFMLEDLGETTVLERLDSQRPEEAHGWYRRPWTSCCAGSKPASPACCRL